MFGRQEAKVGKAHSIRPRRGGGMRIGVGLFLITIGAIFTFAIKDSVSGIDLSALGIILMLVGAVVVALWWYWNSRSSARRRTQIIEREVPVERVVEREVPVDYDTTRRSEDPLPPEGPIPPKGSIGRPPR
jgi:hypothetical protein